MIIEYDDNGRITHAISDPVAKEVREFYLSKPEAMEVARCGLDTHYVKDGAVEERPVPIVGFNVTGRTITASGVPADSVIKVEIEGVTVDADTSIEVDEPGLATIVITPPWPMMEVRHDIEIE